MSPLAAEILKLLAVETLSAESISRVLWVTGYGRTEDPIPATVIDGALHELMASGQVERVHSARLGPRYRAMPKPATVAAGETDRPLP